MRLRCCASSLPSSRSAGSDSSTLQTMTFHCVFERDGFFFAAADAFQSAFGQIQVFEVFQVFDDGLAGVVGFGAPGAPRELLQAFLDGLRKSNGQHKHLAIQVYHIEERRARTDCKLTPLARYSSTSESSNRSHLLIAVLPDV